MSDDRREFAAEMRNETRQERELYAMACIMDADACLDRLAQINDWDDFEGTPRQALELALRAESEQDAGDWATARALAGSFIDDAVADFMSGATLPPVGVEALAATAALLGVEPENTGGHVICFCFTTPSGEPVCFGWANGPLGWSYEDGHDAGDMEREGDASEQAAYIREICARLGITIKGGR